MIVAFEAAQSHNPIGISVVFNDVAWGRYNRSRRLMNKVEQLAARAIQNAGGNATYLTKEIVLSPRSGVGAIVAFTAPRATEEE